MGKAMGQFGVMRVPEQVYAEIGNGDDTDRCCQATSPPMCCRRVMAPATAWEAISQPGCCRMSLLRWCRRHRTIEAGRGAMRRRLPMPGPMSPLYLLEGKLRFSLNGESHDLQAGDFANIPPPKTAYASQVTSGSAPGCSAPQMVMGCPSGTSLEPRRRIHLRAGHG